MEWFNLENSNLYEENPVKGSSEISGPWRCLRPIDDSSWEVLCRLRSVGYICIFDRTLFWKISLPLDKCSLKNRIPCHRTHFNCITGKNWCFYWLDVFSFNSCRWSIIATPRLLMIFLIYAFDFMNYQALTRCYRERATNFSFRYLNRNFQWAAFYNNNLR